LFTGCKINTFMILINTTNKMKTAQEKAFKILVVDDNLTNIEVIGTILNDEKYSVGFATDGKQALENLQKTNDYDLVLLDVEMPVMNGFETCHAIRQDDKLQDMPVIFLTAYRETEHMINGFNIGAQDYITKPFNSKELLARVNTQLQIKLKNEKIKRYALELEKLNATKDKFFSIIAHDLRSPLSGIINLSKALEKNITKHSIDFIEEQFRSIHSATENVASLLENLLSWAGSQSGSIEFNPVDLSLNNTMAKCIELSMPQAQEKRITIINKIQANIVFNTDEELLLSIVRNLLSNAIKYSHESGQITIASVKSEDHLEISIKDNGIGISHEVLNMLFKIESKVQPKPGTAEETGSGLGLILCKEFIEMLGGEIWAESEEGKGSTFTFTIPVGRE
jgi:two-component system, sensor histidine kinase and response regulator